MNDIRTILIDSLKQWNIDISDHQISQFERFYSLLIEWNNKMNLTSITDPVEAAYKHFVDSVSLISYLDLEDTSLIDIGTGAGFPGIPLKIMVPSCNIVLVDSLDKRVRFLQNVIDDLGLDQIDAVHSRAEDLARDKSYRENFDVAVSRAVANLCSLSEYCIPFVKVGGVFASYKSDSIKEELHECKYAVNELGGKINSVESFTIPGTEYNRSIVFIDKLKACDYVYPRKAGLPTKRPLLTPTT